MFTSQLQACFFLYLSIGGQVKELKHLLHLQPEYFVSSPTANLN